jgi:hypothetical protein
LRAAKWQGAPVRHVTITTARHGRVTFTIATNPKWFQVHWYNNDTSMRDSRFLACLEITCEKDASDDLLEGPSPAVVLITKKVSHWSVLTPADVTTCIEHAIHGVHHTDEVNLIHEPLGLMRLKLINRQDLPGRVAILNSALKLKMCGVGSMG